MAKFPVADGSPGTVSCSQLPPSQLSDGQPARRAGEHVLQDRQRVVLDPVVRDRRDAGRRGDSTRTFRSRVTIVPKLDVIVTLTVYVPGSLNAWVTSAPVAFVVRPSPNVQ